MTILPAFLVALPPALAITYAVRSDFRSDVARAFSRRAFWARYRKEHAKRRADLRGVHRRRCQWCDTLQRRGDPALPESSTVCAPCKMAVLTDAARAVRPLSTDRLAASRLVVGTVRQFPAPSERPLRLYV